MTIARDMRLLVCGGRDYGDRDRVFRVLDRINAAYGIACVIHGAARGADSLAAAWAEARGVTSHGYPAQWDVYGNAAGYRRNRKMLDRGRPDHVLAFPGGRGTAMMADISRKAGVAVTEVPA